MVSLSNLKRFSKALILASIGASSLAFAEDNTGLQVITGLTCEFSGNKCYVRIPSVPASTVRCGSSSFVFDAGSAAGKNILSLVTLAFAANKNATIYYYGCTGNDYNLLYVTISK